MQVLDSNDTSQAFAINAYDTQRVTQLGNYCIKGTEQLIDQIYNRVKLNNFAYVEKDIAYAYMG